MKSIAKKIIALAIAGLVLIVVVPLNANAATQNDLSFEVTDGQATIVKCDQNAAGELIIPDTLSGYPVTSIGNEAFYFCEGLTSIIIPANVKKIGNEAFFACYTLKNINVDSGNPVYASENGVLFNKSKTELIQYPAGKTDSSYTIPTGVTSIGHEAFASCSALKNIIIPDSVRRIGEYAFLNCKGLISVNIPNSVTRIGDCVFVFCSALKNISIPESVTSLGEGMFTGTDSLISINVSITNNVYASENGVLFNHSKEELIFYPEGKTGAYIIPNSVKRIVGYAFSGCNGLTGITFPKSVSSIGEHAFEYCTSLKNITIPDSVKSIGYRALYGTGWYSNQPDGLIYTGKVAYYYKGYIPDNTTVVIKPGTKGIAGGAFEPEASEETNPGLIGVSIPSTVTNIGDQAFANCTGLKSITIPQNVVSIGEQAFGYYIGLESAEKNPGFIINCFADSAGLKYAKENGFEYNILPASAATTDPTAPTTGPTDTMSLTETTTNPTTTTSTTDSNGISNRGTITAIILTSAVLLAVAAAAVFITVKRKKK